MGLGLSVGGGRKGWGVTAGQEGVGLPAMLRCASERAALGHRPVTVASAGSGWLMP